MRGVRVQFGYVFGTFWVLFEIFNLLLGLFKVLLWFSFDIVWVYSLGTVRLTGKNTLMHTIIPGGDSSLCGSCWGM